MLPAHVQQRSHPSNTLSRGQLQYHRKLANHRHVKGQQINRTVQTRVFANFFASIFPQLRADSAVADGHSESAVNGSTDPDRNSNVATAAQKAVNMKEGKSEDVVNWAKTASKDTQDSIIRAAKFEDEKPELMADEAVEAAKAVDEVVEKAMWELKDDMVVSIGPFEVTSEGVMIKPKFEIGLEWEGLDISMGFEDIRDGLEFGYTADQELFSFSQEGDDLQEILDTFEITALGCVEVPDFVARQLAFLMSAPVLPRMLLETIGVDTSFKYYKINARLETGVGYRTQWGLGRLLKDNEGFYMFGGGGDLAFGAKIQGHLMFGYKEDGFRLRVAMPPGIKVDVQMLGPYDDITEVLESLSDKRDEVALGIFKNLARFLSGGKPYGKKGLLKA